MVILNKYISFEKSKLNNNLNKYTNENIRLDSILNLDEIILEKIKKRINKTINEFFENDHQLYLSMNENHCVYKHKRGKNEGNFCCKKITINGDKNEYLCTKHNKKHIPKKKNKISKNCKLFENTKNIDNLIKINNNNRYKNRIFKKKLKKNNKIFICNSGFIDFKQIFNNIL